MKPTTFTYFLHPLTYSTCNKCTYAYIHTCNSEKSETTYDELQRAVSKTQQKEKQIKQLMNETMIGYLSADIIEKMKQIQTQQQQQQQQNEFNVTELTDVLKKDTDTYISKKNIINKNISEINQHNNK